MFLCEWLASTEHNRCIYYLWYWVRYFYLILQETPTVKIIFFCALQTSMCSMRNLYLIYAHRAIWHKDFNDFHGNLFEFDLKVLHVVYLYSSHFPRKIFFFNFRKRWTWGPRSYLVVITMKQFRKFYFFF